MGRHSYTKDLRVSVGPQGQRKAYVEHDERDGAKRGGSVNRVWRRGGDKKVSFQTRGPIGKGRGRGRGHKFDVSRVNRVLHDNDDDMGKPSIQAGRSRPVVRGLGSKMRGRGHFSRIDRGQFKRLAPLSDENKTIITEAMNERYYKDNKALDLNNFGADNRFGGSSGAIGYLTDERVVEVVLNTIAQHLSDLKALNLSNNSLRTLREFAQIAEKAPHIEIMYLDKNKLVHSSELNSISRLKLVDIKLDGNPFIANFRDGAHYSSVIQRKFKSLQLLDGKQLTKLITFEEEESAARGPSVNLMPSIPKMVVNDQIGDFIGKFLEQYFKVYDSDNREQLAMAYHEEAMMSMHANFPASFADDETKNSYITESRNLNKIRDIRREKLLHKKRLQIMGFLDKLPKTQHDLTTFTLDIPFATERLITFTVSGAFRERNVNVPRRIFHFDRFFTVVPQGEGLCIINDSLFVTNASREQAERSNALFSLSELTGMNLHWTKICLEGQGWHLEQAKNAYGVAKQEGKIPPEAFT